MSAALIFAAWTYPPTEKRRACLTHGIGCLFIDYAQRITVPRADRTTEVSQVARGMKNLARDLQIPVISLAQVVKGVDQRVGDKRPTAGDLANSDELTREADQILMLYRDEVYIRCGQAFLNAYKAEAKIEINRQIIVGANGGTGLDASVTAVFYRGIELIWDPTFELLDAKLGAITYPWTKRCYLLNRNFITFRPVKGNWMKKRKPEKLPDRYVTYYAQTNKYGLTKVLRLAPSVTLGMYQRLGGKVGHQDLLPSYAVDAPAGAAGSSEPTLPMSSLLKMVGSSMSAQKANQLLKSIGVLEQRERPSSGSRIKKYWTLTDAGLQYGKNLTSPENPRETQPHYYVSSFGNLMDLILGRLHGAAA
ncbi:DnaB-like helicase C-terminal domain-containing protein [Stenotrophomonas sp. WED208]|uniref:DnaB-like helicase C-terminal domain-containing protein n=1 Tax=Stenotrophomonas sp. WED208 TaxID=3112800 RepID=UPI0034D3987E